LFRTLGDQGLNEVVFKGHATLIKQEVHFQKKNSNFFGYTTGKGCVVLGLVEVGLHI
jgi:hypothetical protein